MYEVGAFDVVAMEPPVVSRPRIVRSLAGDTYAVRSFVVLAAGTTSATYPPRGFVVRPNSWSRL